MLSSENSQTSVKHVLSQQTHDNDKPEVDQTAFCSRPHLLSASFGATGI